MKTVIVFLIVVAAYVGIVIYANYSPPVEREIRDWHDLQAVRNHRDEDFILMNDLDSTTRGYEELASPIANEGKGWRPIGTAWEPFAGTFDGQGYEIKDLFIDRSDKWDWQIGLFGCTNNTATIKNVGVVNANIFGWWEVGSLVGANWGTIINSYSTGSVTGIKYVGGLVGCHSYGTVSKCYSTCKVTGPTYNSGGLVGLLRYGGTVNNDAFWDTETSGMEVSFGGIGKNTTEMQDITTFSSAGWDIIAVANPSTRDPSHIWNIVDGETYPFLSWEPVS